MNIKFDHDIMAEIVSSLPGIRQDGEGVTAREVAETSPYSMNTIRRTLKEKGLVAVKMYDFDGVVRDVYVNKD